jgi:hypothetical protein
VSERSRLIGGCLVAAAGAIVALLASRSDWVRVSVPGRAVPVEGERRAVVFGVSRSVAGSDVSNLLVPASFVSAAAAASALLAGPRARPWLVAGAALSAAVTIGAAASKGWSETTWAVAVPGGSAGLGSISLHRTAARWVATGAAAVALIAAVLAFAPAARVPRLGMPEGPPQPDEP